MSTPEWKWVKPHRAILDLGCFAIAVCHWPGGTWRASLTGGVSEIAVAIDATPDAAVARIWPCLAQAVQPALVAIASPPRSPKGPEGK